MAKGTKVRLPPSPEARDQLFAAIRAAEGPLAAGDLAKRLAPAHRVVEADLLPVLDEEVAAGRLFSFPGKTGRSKRRYWDRDVRGLARAALAEVVARAASPVSAKEAAKALPAAARLSDGELTVLLEEQVASGSLHRFPPATPKGKPRYWTGDSREFGRRTIRNLIAEKGPQPDAALKRSLKGISATEADQVIAAALADREIWRHPPVGKSKKTLLGANPPAPEPYLRDVGRQLADVVERLMGANVPMVALRRAVVQLMESAGIPFSSAAMGDRETAEAPSAAVDLIGLMRRIEPGADRGALVGMRDLRRAARLEKDQFDRAVLNLARKGAVSLHRHDFAASLSREDRDELVNDGEGTYFVGVAIRQSD